METFKSGKLHFGNWPASSRAQQAKNAFFSSKMLPQLDLELSKRPAPSKIEQFDYDFEFTDELHARHKELFEQLETIADFDRASKVIQGIRAYGALPRMISSITGEKMAITVAWLKAFEMWHLPEMRKHVENVKLSGSPLKCMFLAEFPGTFIWATQFFIAMNRPAVLRKQKWKWTATSLPPGEEGILGDVYGLFKRYPKNWILMDVTKDKDINALPKHEYLVVTGDIGIPIKEWDKQENESFRIELGQFICAIVTLANGGTAMLKMFHSFNASTCSILRIATALFNCVRIFKPRVSKEMNQEVYWILSDFDQAEADKIIPKLIKILNASSAQTGRHRPFVPRESFDDDLLIDIYNLGLQRSIVDKFHIRYVLKYLNKFKGVPTRALLPKVLERERNVSRKNAEEWLEHFPVQSTPIKLL